MPNVDGALFLTGKGDLGEVVEKTVSMNFYLLGYHFTDSLIFFTKERLIILTSTKKGKLLPAFWDYFHKKIYFICLYCNLDKFLVSQNIELNPLILADRGR